MMTRQEVFAKVVTHLRKQGRKAMRNEGEEGCAYRSYDGLQCAAGCLIADEHYSPALEGKSVSWAGVATALERSGVLELELLSDLQRTHDHWPVENWEEEFAGIAQKWSLALP